MWFWKRKKGKPVYRHSIGEKIRYYEGLLNSKDPAVRDRAKANLARLHRYADGQDVFGKVFIVRDKEFNSYADKNKTRRVVCVGVNGNKLQVIPVRRNKNMVSLSNFDHQRSINVNGVREISINEVYEKRTFRKTGNDYLTNQEKLELNKKLKSKNKKDLY